MNENEQVNSVEFEDDSANEIFTEVDNFDDLWYDGDDRPEVDEVAEPDNDADETDGEEAEADQQEAESAEENTAEETAVETTEEPSEKPEDKGVDQRFTLKHLDEVKEVGRDEVVELAQKGLDYDRVKQQLTEARENVTKNSQYEAFLKELAESSGNTVEELIDSTRARMLVAKEEGLSYENALERVRDAKPKAVEAPKEEPPAKAEPPKDDGAAARQQSFLRFAKEYPDVKPSDIPVEVWTAFSAGEGDLAGLYALHENKKLREENKALKQNDKNKSRSTGSQKSAGSKSDKDSFDALWYDGT